MTNYTCTTCGVHKNTAGHSVCHSCLETKIRGLTMRVRAAEAELYKYENGLPIEKAKECGDYYCLDLGYCVATHFENGKWYYSDDGPNRNPCEVSNRLYPLPSTETQRGR